MADLNTIEHLVEFGLGIAVAQQMVSTMNHVVDNTRIPGVENKFLECQKNVMAYYVVIDGQQGGAFDEEELKTLIQSNKLTKETLMWTKGMPAWKLAGELSEINKIFMLYPPKSK